MKKILHWLRYDNPLARLRAAEDLNQELYAMLSQARKTCRELQAQSLDYAVALRFASQTIHSRNLHIEELNARLGDAGEWISQVAEIDDLPMADVIVFPNSKRLH